MSFKGEGQALLDTLVLQSAKKEVDASQLKVRPPVLGSRGAPGKPAAAPGLPGGRGTAAGPGMALPRQPAPGSQPPSLPPAGARAGALLRHVRLQHEQLHRPGEQVGPGRGWGAAVMQVRGAARRGGALGPGCAAWAASRPRAAPAHPARPQTPLAPAGARPASTRSTA